MGTFTAIITSVIASPARQRRSEQLVKRGSGETSLIHLKLPENLHKVRISGDGKRLTFRRTTQVWTRF
ncbi:MAG: hypothetical protein VB858_11090 [Planctomycetaceae bacterium]